MTAEEPVAKLDNGTIKDIFTKNRSTTMVLSWAFFLIAGMQVGYGILAYFDFFPWQDRNMTIFQLPVFLALILLACLPAAVAGIPHRSPY